MSPLKNYKIDDIKSKFSTVALDNTYQVVFNHNDFIIKEATKLGFTLEFLNEDLGLYVKDAVLPGSSFGDVEVSGDRQGITERVAFSRIYDDITLTFYVDRAYNVLKFFELWNQTINPIFGRSRAATMRFRYPDEYKCDFLIFKFNKDFFLGDDPNTFSFASENYRRKTIKTYRVLRAWPYSVASVPVNYDGQAALELSVTFRYDRYTTDLISDTARQELIDSLLNVGGIDFVRDPNFVNPDGSPRELQFGVDNTGQFGNTGFGITRIPRLRTQATGGNLLGR